MVGVRGVGKSTYPPYFDPGMPDMEYLPDLPRLSISDTRSVHSEPARYQSWGQ